MMKKFLVLASLTLAFLCNASPMALKITFSPDTMKDWQKTRSTEFKVEAGAAVLDGTTWDSKIFRHVELAPQTRYRLSGVGKGKIMVLVYPSLKWESDKLCILNLCGKEFRSNHVDFTTPSGNGKHLLAIHINAGQGHGEVQSLSFAPIPEEKAVILDPARLKANRPDPKVVRGFMVGPVFTEETAKEVRSWGADAIRYQVILSGKSGKTPEELLPLCLDRLETALKAARKYKIKVVVDLQDPRVFHRNKEIGFWQQPTLEKDFVDFWTQVAERMKPYGDTVWGYDLCNEPLDWDQLPYPPREWRPIALKVLEAIRKIDKNVWIVFEPGPGGGYDAYKTMQPLPDYRVIYSCHYYYPHEFTHQGILNIDKTDLTEIHKKINIRYPGKIGGVMWNKERIRESMKGVREFQKKYPVPFFLGEFSAARWAPGAEIYLKDCIDVFEENGWSWAYHALNDWSGWSLYYGKTYWIDAMGWNHPDRPRKRVEGLTDRGKVVKDAFEKNQQ